MFGIIPFLATLLAFLALTVFQSFAVMPSDVVHTPTPDTAVVNQLENSVETSPVTEPETESPEEVAAEATSETTKDQSAVLIAPIRVHIISSEIDYLDAASIYSNEIIYDYFEQINEVFAQANVTWVVESIVVEELFNDQAIADAITNEDPNPGRVLGAQVDQSRMLDPNGWDLYVVRKTVPFGFGGVYMCNVNGAGTAGASFVPLISYRDTPQEMRRWAHELGHATGLRHPACEETFADNVMMSGTCGYRIIDRTDFDEDEIEKIRLEVAKGKAGCF